MPVCAAGLVAVATSLIVVDAAEQKNPRYSARKSDANCVADEPGVEESVCSAEITNAAPSAETPGPSTEAAAGAPKYSLRF